jgi:hypothetical protein
VLGECVAMHLTKFLLLHLTRIVRAQRPYNSAFEVTGDWKRWGGGGGVENMTRRRKWAESAAQWGVG